MPAFVQKQFCQTTDSHQESLTLSNCSGYVLAIYFQACLVPMFWQGPLLIPE